MHEYHVLELQIEMKANDPTIYKIYNRASYSVVLLAQAI